MSVLKKSAYQNIMKKINCHLHLTKCKILAIIGLIPEKYF